MEEEFTAEVKEITLRDFKNGVFSSNISVADIDISNLTCQDEKQTDCLNQPDFYQLHQIFQEALKNIDEEKLYTKHIFDRFDLEALITTVVRKGSYIAFIIASAYIFKRI